MTKAQKREQHFQKREQRRERREALGFSNQKKDVLSRRRVKKYIRITAESKLAQLNAEKTYKLRLAQIKKQVQQSHWIQRLYYKIKRKLLRIK